MWKMSDQKVLRINHSCDESNFYLNLFKWHLKSERLIEIWIKCAFLYSCLLFLHSLAALYQCQFDIWICKNHRHIIAKSNQHYSVGCQCEYCILKTFPLCNFLKWGLRNAQYWVYFIIQKFTAFLDILFSMPCILVSPGTDGILRMETLCSCKFSVGRFVTKSMLTVILGLMVNY